MNVSSYGDITEFRAQGAPTIQVSDSGSASNDSQKETVVMDFAYKADLIFEVMVTQRREAREPQIREVKVTDRTRCPRCVGTGSYITGTVNGKPVGPGGPCFRCAGKGFQTDEDRRRNYGYDNFGQRVSVAS